MSTLITTGPVLLHPPIYPSTPQVTHETILQCFKDAVFIPKAKKAGLKPVIYEDGYYDKIDYPGHIGPGTKSTWHNVQSVWFGKNIGCAADLNLNISGQQEYLWFKNNIIPVARLWGLGYHWEANHLHVEVGTWSNEGNGLTSGGKWYKRGTEGKPDFKATGVIPVDGKWSTNTTKALQRLVGASIDGNWGPKTTKAVQTWLTKRGYPLVKDGDLGPKTKAAMQKVVGTRQPFQSTWFNVVWQVRLNGTYFHSIGSF